MTWTISVSVVTEIVINIVMPTYIVSQLLRLHCFEGFVNIDLCIVDLPPYSRIRRQIYSEIVHSMPLAWVSELTNESMNEWADQWDHEWVSWPMRAWVSDLTNENMSEWADQWEHEWVIWPMRAWVLLPGWWLAHGAQYLISSDT